MASRGTSTFIVQRASAVLLIPFAIWFLWSLIAHAGDSYAAMIAWLGAPLTKFMFGGFVAVGAFHGRVGLEEVIDDYIHGPARRPLIALSWVAAASVIVVTLAALFSI